jgi:DNA-binding transcriptional MerR regulator
MGSYTARELERDTGFGRRTIAYYVQEGLLPRVGRRGPRTRYPELVRDRLLFIRRVREAEAEGEIAPVPLSDLRKLFLHAPPQLIASVAAGETPVTADIVSPLAAERRSMLDRVAALKDRLADARYGSAAESPSFSPREHGGRTRRAGEEAILHRLEAPRNPMRQLEESVDDPDYRSRGAEESVADVGTRYRGTMARDEDPETLGHRLAWALRKLQVQARRRRKRSPDALDTWSQIEITSEIRLSVRGMADEDGLLLKLAGRLLRRLLESGSSPAAGGSRQRER